MRNYLKIPPDYKHLENFLERKLWTGQDCVLSSLPSTVYSDRVAVSPKFSLLACKAPANTLSYGDEEAASFHASTSTLEGAAWIKFWHQEVKFALLFPIHPTQQPGLLVGLFLVIVFLTP